MPKHASWNNNRLMREPEEQIDPRKAAVEASIARAKARKLEQQQQANAEPEEQVDPRKAAVELAIASRQSASWNSNNRLMRNQKNRLIHAKRQVAAAIARVQGQKAAQQKVVNEGLNGIQNS